MFDCSIEIPHRWYSIEEILPYEQYTSGAKDDDKPEYRNPVDSSSNPILTLEFDILNKEGYGLKKGYYEIATNQELSYLMFVEGGKIKAKIPVIKQERINEYGLNYEWEKIEQENYTAENIASKKIYKPVYSKKEQKRRAKTYKKGKDPSTYFHSRAYMEYDRELDLYKVIFEKYNTRLIGVIYVNKR